MGRASIFRGKDNGTRVQGIITKRGGIVFELARKELRALVAQVQGEEPRTVSDADVIEYLARGSEETVQYLQRSRRS